MCDFNPGDEVVCVNVTPMPNKIVSGLVLGRTYTVSHIGPSENPSYPDSIFVFLVETRNDREGLFSFDTGYFPSRFRKVQRRDLSAWLKTSIGNTDKLDKRQKTKA